MSNQKNKPISITLAAALILCIITFILGFVISSYAMLDSRLEAANEKNAELKETIKSKEAEIKELNKTIEQKDESNIILGEQIQAHLDTIDSLNGEIAILKNDVTYTGTVLSSEDGNSFVVSFSKLSVSQQLMIFVVLFVIIIFIISITCSLIASKSATKAGDSKTKRYRAPQEDNLTDTENSESESETEETLSPVEITESEPYNEEPKDSDIITQAISMLYSGSLEESMSDLSGFRFGITNFDDVLSDKANGKSFGNSENGDFVAFMSTKSAIKKLYIIPRYLTLSDSTVALRGVTDLFDVTDERGNEITYGTLKVKTVDAPAIFACGENGWAIESKGKITALGAKNI